MKRRRRRWRPHPVEYHLPDEPKFRAYAEWCQVNGRVPLIFPDGLLGTEHYNIRKDGGVYKARGRTYLGPAMLCHRVGDEGTITLRVNRKTLIADIEGARWRILTRIVGRLTMLLTAVQDRIKGHKRTYAVGPNGAIYGLYTVAPDEEGTHNLFSTVVRTPPDRKLSALEQLAAAENSEGADIISAHLKINSRLARAVRHERRLGAYLKRLLGEAAYELPRGTRVRAKGSIFFDINGRHYLAFPPITRLAEGWPHPGDSVIRLPQG